MPATSVTSIEKGLGIGRKAGSALQLLFQPPMVGDIRGIVRRAAGAVFDPES